MHAGDDEAVALVGEVLEHRPGVLAHQDRVRRVVVDAELVPHAVALTDLVQGDPHRGGVADVVVEVVARRPAGHRALLDPVGEPAVLGRLQQRDEALLEVDQVLVHRLRLVAPDEANDRRDAQEHRGVHDPHHEVVLLAADRGVLVQHVVEVGDVGDRHARRVDSGLDALGPLLVERVAQVQGVGDRVEHGLRGDVGQGRVQRRRELDAVHTQLGGEVQPLLDGEVRIGVALLPWRQLLQCRGQHADGHEDGLVGLRLAHGRFLSGITLRRR